MLYTSDYFINLVDNFKHSKSYVDNKNAVRGIGIEYQHSYYNNVVYYWSEIAHIENKLYSLAKRYGLIKEFKNNGVI